MHLEKVRSLPYPLWKQWWLFYLLEPWGFDDREYRTSSILAQLNNVNAAKRSQTKKATHYMRDMFKKVMEAIQSEKRKLEAPKYDLDTPEGRAAASEEVIKMFQSMFGKRVERKDK